MSEIKILLVDDHSMIRFGLKSFLEDDDIVVTAEAKNGIEALELLKDIQVDVVVTDIMMPEIDGYEVLYLLSKNPSTASIPFVFLTAKAEMTDLRKGMNMGADDYITKPYEEIELLTVVERRLKRYEEISKTGEIEELISTAGKYQSIEELDSITKSRNFKEKDVIYREGDFGSFVYKIRRGKVKTYRMNSDGTWRFKGRGFFRRTSCNTG